MKAIFLVGFVLIISIISGCMSIPTSPTPRFYMLSAVDETQASQKINLPQNVIIGIGPVKIPEYLDRPQIVTQTSEKMLQLAQFDRWGESLNGGLGRLIREDLAAMVPKAKLTLYPWNPALAVRYQVIVEVVQLDSELDKNMDFIVQWEIIDLQNSKTVIIKNSRFHQPINPQNYSGLAKTLSTACASLSTQIAQALATLN